MLRISLPERVPLAYAFLYAAGLFLLQQLEHTSLYFSACSFLFIVIAALAFNVAGGLTRPSGGYIFFYSILAVILGLSVKAFLGERGESNLLRPHLTITIYALSSAGLLLASAASRKFAKKRPLLENLVGDNNLSRATVGCLVIGIVLSVATRTVERGSGTALSALFQINRFCELAIILGVTNTIRLTGGRRSTNVPVLIAAATLLAVGGLLGFSKEGFFTPVVCWLVAASAQRFRLSTIQIIGGLLLLAFLAYYMVPYSQYGRTQMRPGFSASLEVTFRLLSDLPSVRQKFEAQQAADVAEGSSAYFNKPQGIFDRLQMISFDDMLTDATERQGPEGYFPIIVDFENLVPHVFWPGKPQFLWGNVYAHEAGVSLAEEDTSTGVSFSPSGEAFHVGRWVGLLILAPCLWFSLFLLFDSLCGDVRDSPWGLLVITYFAHMASEGMLAGIIYAMGYVTFAITFAAVTTGYIMPILGSLFIGPGNIAGGRTPPVLQPIRAGTLRSSRPPRE